MLSKNKFIILMYGYQIIFLIRKIPAKYYEVSPQIFTGIYLFLFIFLIIKSCFDKSSEKRMWSVRTRL